MKRWAGIGLATAVCLLATALASGQERETTREPTVEELFLRDIEFQVLKEQAFQGDRELKLSVLDTIEDKLQSGELGQDDIQLQFVLEYLSLEGTAVRIREGRTLVNNFPMVRRRATQMLGEIASENSIPTLLVVLLRDEESMVRAEAAFALGAVGSAEQAVIDSLVFAVRRLDPVAPDNSFAFASAVAFEKIAAANNGLTDPNVFTALVQLAQGNYFRRVRNKALQVLDDMRNYR